MTFETDGWKELVRWTLSWQPDIEVLEPERDQEWDPSKGGQAEAGSGAWHNLFFSASTSWRAGIRPACPLAARAGAGRPHGEDHPQYIRFVGRRVVPLFGWRFQSLEGVSRLFSQQFRFQA